MSARAYKQMTFDDRVIIENQLNVPGVTLKQITQTLDRDGKTIRYEIKGHRCIFLRANQRNKCGRQNSCETVRLCTHCITGLCKFCRFNNCNDLCSQFASDPHCEKLDRFPFVCSNCSELGKCKLPKYFYKAQHAQAERDSNVRVWKTGPQKSEAEMKPIIEAFQDGVSRGIAPAVIIHENSLDLSVSTSYRYIHHRHMGAVMPIDLKRAVRYAPQDRSSPRTTPINYDFLKGRKYEDFCSALLTWSPTVNIWEMDTVIGKKGTDKCVLSLLFRKTNLQLYFLLESRTALEVQRVMDGIKLYLGPKCFSETFTVILTDNGSEFQDPVNLETDPNTGEKLISIFYCDPRHSEQKGKCEKNHEHFREMIPKGADMTRLTRNDIRSVSNNVNNYPRKDLNFKTPLALSKDLLSKKVFELNKLQSLNLNQVNLTPIIR